MKDTKPEFNRVAIKVGSHVITQSDGSLNEGRILRIVEDIAILIKQGREVVLISSGAVAAGHPGAGPPCRVPRRAPAPRQRPGKRP